LQDDLEEETALKVAELANIKGITAA